MNYTNPIELQQAFYGIIGMLLFFVLIAYSIARVFDLRDFEEFDEKCDNDKNFNNENI
jgi:hypothetical protein